MAAITGEVHRVATLLLERIVSGVYPTGFRLPTEKDMAYEFKVARGTVREAVTHLAAMGLVQTRRGSGIQVLDFRTKGIPAMLPEYVMAGRFDMPLGVLVTELLHFRRLLASEAARLAAAYSTPESLQPAKELLLQFMPHQPVHKVIQWEFEYYLALARSSQVWPAVWLANAFLEPMRDLNFRFAAIGAVPDNLSEMVIELMRRIEGKDVEGAQSLVLEHFAAIDKALIGKIATVLAENPSPQPPTPVEILVNTVGAWTDPMPHLHQPEQVVVVRRKRGRPKKNKETKEIAKKGPPSSKNAAPTSSRSPSSSRGPASSSSQSSSNAAASSSRSPQSNKSPSSSKNEGPASRNEPVSSRSLARSSLAQKRRSTQTRTSKRKS